METLQIPPEAQVRLDVAISSDTHVATNVSINDAIVEKSSEYHFTAELGVVSQLTNKGLTVVSTFFVQTGNLTAIMKATRVDNTLLYDDQQVCLKVHKRKISATLFIVYSSVTLEFEL